MPTKRMTMRKLRDILRLRLQSELSLRQIKHSLRLSLGAIQKVASRAQTLQLEWEAIEQLTDQQLASLFYPEADTRPSKRLEMPAFPEIHRELNRKGMTKQLLWEEYTEQYPNRSYSYAQFCHLYNEWKAKLRRSMRQTHKAGEKLFVDYAGPTVPIVDASTGEIRDAQIFVAVLGASNYTYAEATLTQSLPDWLNSHARAFEYFGGVVELVVPDNLRSGVKKACRYDPDINPAYQQLAAHYGTAILPARPYKPKDKAKAEVGVQVVERWILARLRHHTFFSLSELNQVIKTLLVALNDRPFKQLQGSRREWFETLDQPALNPLPKQRYQYTDIKRVKVNIDYHVQYDQHLYSVPHQFVGETLELHASTTLITLHFQNTPVASHPRQYRQGTTTRSEHMPVRHQQHHQWSPGRLMNWAKELGDEVLCWVKVQLERKEHPEQTYRVCLGLLNLTHSYSPERLNAACSLANQKKLYRLKQVKGILRSNQDQLPTNLHEQSSLLPQDHENIRGPNNYQ